MKRVYLDSNVFISFIKQEIDKNFRLLYKEAEDFINYCPNNYVLVLSNHCLNEIETIIHYSKQDVLDFFQKRKILVELIKATKCDQEAVLKFCVFGMHRADAWHASLAINAKCDFIVTFNAKDFIFVEFLISVKEPLLLLE